MEHIPLLAKEGAKREPDRAKPQEKPRHQKMGPFRAAPGAKREPDRAKPQLMVSSAKLFRPEDFAELTTPSAALSVASQLLVDAAATPPLRGGEYSTYNIFFNSFTSSTSAPM